MTLGESKKWLSDHNFVYDGYTMCFIPPNIIHYINNEGLRATLEDEAFGELLVDKIPMSNNKTLDLFRIIIESKT